MRLRRRRRPELELRVELWHVGLNRCIASRGFTGQPPLELVHELRAMAAEGIRIAYVDPAELRVRVRVREL